jgi:hypothetical protein
MDVEGQRAVGLNTRGLQSERNDPPLHQVAFGDAKGQGPGWLIRKPSSCSQTIQVEPAVKMEVVTCQLVCIEEGFGAGHGPFELRGSASVRLRPPGHTNTFGGRPLQ